MIEHRADGDNTGTLYRINIFNETSQEYEPLVYEGTTEHCWSLSLTTSVVDRQPTGTPYELVALWVGIDYTPRASAYGFVRKRSLISYNARKRAELAVTDQHE